MKQQDLDQILDTALDEIRDSEPDPQQERRAAAQVWQRISEEVQQLSASAEESPGTIRDCSDYQALIPAYLRGALNEAKTLLVQDHLRECVPCRRAMKQARAAQRGPATPGGETRPAGAWVTWGWRIAAAAAIVVALIGLDFKTNIFSIETGGVIRIQDLEGEVFQVTGDGIRPLQEGDRIDFSDVTGIRTGKDARAMFVMADNSVVEMNERAELAVKNTRKPWQRGRGDRVIDLSRGNIIVEAADQGDDELRVRTADCNVEVTGTVFAVNHGMKGSRISVVEGEVEVAYSGQHDVLLAGQQATTRTGLRPTRVEDEIAWSARLEEHLRLLKEFTLVTQQIEDAVKGPGQRFSTALLDMAPEDTIVYIGIPNFSSTLDQAYGMLQDKIAGSELLREWWDEKVAGTEAEEHIEYAMEFIRGAGGQLGEEIAVTLQMDAANQVEEPLVFARLARASEFPAFVESELDRLEAHAGERPNVRVIVGELADGLSAGPAELYLWIQGDLLTVAGSAERLRERAAAPSPGRFASTEFHGRLAALYRDGVEWVFGVNVAPLMASGEQNEERELFEELGLVDLEHVIAERTSLEGGPNENRIELGFNQPRRGLASWLAEPAPMGSLEFISPDASLAAGFVMKEPSAALDELFRIFGSRDANFNRTLDEFEAEYGIDLRRDIASAVGGEFAVALDGPALPVPAWKVIVEIYDEQRLEAALAWAVERINELATGSDFQGLVIEHEEQRGRTYHRLRSLDAGVSAHYTYVDGYLVASSSRVLLDQAIQRREAGVHLLGSPKFTSLLPADSQINSSAVVYQHMGGLFGDLAGQFRGFATRLSEENQRLIKELGDATRPTLTLAYGEENRITIVHSDRGGLLGSGLSMLLRLDTLLSVQELLRQAEEETRHDPQQEAPAVDEPQVDPALTRG